MPGNHDFAIKLVHPDWMIDPVRGQRVGFAPRYYRTVANWPAGGRMLVYVIGKKLLIDALEVTGSTEQAELLHLPHKPAYPILLPTRLLYRGTYGIPLPEIRSVFDFQPMQRSWVDLTPEQYDVLLAKLVAADQA